MIAANHPAMGAALSVDPLAERGWRGIQPPGPILTPMQPVRTVETTQPVLPPSVTPPEPLQHPNPPASSASSSSSSSSSSTSTSSTQAIHVSNLIDPVTGITYAGYLTPDAETLYNSGSLITGGNELTAQGSALAAQGDLITGTPAPTSAQIAQSSAGVPVSSSNSFMDWLAEETWFPGYPNGLIAAGGVILAAWLFGGKRRR